MDDTRLPLGELQGGLRRSEIPPRHEDALDSRLVRSPDDRVLLSLEPGVLQVGVRVDESRQPRGPPTTTQATGSSSTRGKMGLAWVVC
ncbi:MAG: hypothetical protein M3Y40_04030 [Chloroflexota bacterium]|nr:hypothetical protein [Chloroflexota bacterium]